MQIVTHIPPSFHLPPSRHGVAPDGSVTHNPTALHLPVTNHVVLGQSKGPSKLWVGIMIAMGVVAAVGLTYAFTKMDFWPER